MGYLIEETTETGILIKDYVWQEGMYPIAQIDNTTGTEQVLYLHNDHLMTNRLATDQAQNVVWRWEGEAFGNTQAQELAGFDVNLRFPGQYFDQETNLHYNHHRYYDPELGRYITSDPIGLLAGLNTYSYVGQNSVGGYDPQGLVDGTGLLINGGGFIFSTIETGVGMSMMFLGSTGPGNVMFAGGVAMVAHGELGMANSAIGVRNALNGTNQPGLAATVGDAIAGDLGRKTGEILDGISGAASMARSMQNMARNADTMADAASDISNSASFLDKFNDNQSPLPGESATSFCSRNPSALACNPGGLCK